MMTTYTSDSHFHVLRAPQLKRVLTVDTVRDDITAKDLARLLNLSVDYLDTMLDGMSPEDQKLVMANTRPAP